LSTNLYLSGTLPTELGFLTMLTELRLIYTALSGTIPTEFGQLSLLGKQTEYVPWMDGSIDIFLVFSHSSFYIPLGLLKTLG
jgi:hypothetical protein